MNRIVFVILFTIFYGQSTAQNKSGYTWIIGADAMYASFSGDTSRPIIGQKFSTTYPFHPYIFVNSQSNICDSATGKLLFMSDGMRLYDTLGGIVENGDSLQPHNIYMHNCCPAIEVNTEGSLILPKGSNGLYYVIIPTITDSAYTTYVTGGQNKVPYDLLQYHVVDMNANGGLGKVVQKNIQLLSNVEMCKTGMMACRHANGHDWWLLKQALDTNIIYTFLVTADTIKLELLQGFTEPKFGFYDLVGQSCFSSDGTKYAFASGGVNSQGDKLFIADFDRCTGVISNPKSLHAPLHKSNTILDSLYPGEKDTMITGLAFSQNDSFLYVSKSYNIYQYELKQPDSILAWYHVQYGPDTSFTEFVTYGQLQRGIDNRIYIGKSLGASGLQNSVIDYPNLKGVACGFCRKCLRYDVGIDYISSPPNMPDFNLGKKEPCWPLSSGEIKDIQNELIIYPNPTSDKVMIQGTMAFTSIKIFSILSEVVFEAKTKPTKRLELDVSNIPMGIYFIRIDDEYIRKIVIEK